MESNPLVAADTALRDGDLERAATALDASLPEHAAEAAASLGLRAEWVAALLRIRLLRKRVDLGDALEQCDALLAQHPSCVPALVLSIDLAVRCERNELAAHRLRDVRAYCTYENARVDEVSLDALESAFGVESKLRLVAVRAASWFNARIYGHAASELERVADRYAAVSPAWRRLMAMWLYAVAHGDSWSRLAERAKPTTPRQAFLTVAPACAYEHAGGYLEAVAGWFLHCGRLGDCVRVFDRAIAIARRAQVPAADLGRMLAVLGGALIAHDTPRANAVLEEANGLVDETREPGIAAALHLHWGALCLDLDRLPDAARCFDRAAALARTAHNWLATVNLHRTLLDVERGATDAALEKARGAEQSFELPRQRGAAVASQGFACLCAGQIEAAREHLDRAQLFLRESSPREAARVDCYRAVANADTQTLEESTELLEAARRVLAAVEDRHGLVLAAACRHLVLGDALPDLQTGPIEGRLLLRTRGLSTKVSP